MPRDWRNDPTWVMLDIMKRRERQMRQEQREAQMAFLAGAQRMSDTMTASEFSVFAATQPPKH